LEECLSILSREIMNRDFFGKLYQAMFDEQVKRLDNISLQDYDEDYEY
jgi:hypothetical protein